MKILFLASDLQVKHLHMAYALKDNTDHELHFMHQRPTHRFGSGHVTHFLQDAKESGVFSTINRYFSVFSKLSIVSKHRIRRLRPDLIYVHNIEGVNAVKGLDWRPTIVCDILDSVLLNTDPSPTAVKRERDAVTSPHVDYLLLPSDGEAQAIKERWDFTAESRVQYPLVAKRTLPQHNMKKTDEFSVVYTGSIQSGDEHRDMYGLLEQLGKAEVVVHVYLLNDFSTSQWMILESIARKYRTVHAHRRLPIYHVKTEIQQYHVGLHFGADTAKLRATYGMKPLEYAYAGVTPVCISEQPRAAYNLSDGEPFGYIAEVNNIEEKYDGERLSAFDWEHHLMDNHLKKFKELEE